MYMNQPTKHESRRSQTKSESNSRWFQILELGKEKTLGSYQSTNMNQRRSNERSFDLDTKKKVDWNPTTETGGRA